MPTYGGAWPAMVTPYDDTLRIDRGAYRALCDWAIAHGAGGLYANCLTSEMYLLDGDERLLLVRDSVDAAGGRVPVAATGNLGSTIAEHIRRAPSTYSASGACPFRPPRGIRARPSRPT